MQPPQCGQCIFGGVSGRRQKMFLNGADFIISEAVRENVWTIQKFTVIMNNVCSL